MDDTKKRLKCISFSNPGATSFVEGIHHLVPVCLASYEDLVSEKWEMAIKKYRYANTKPSSHKHFEFEDVYEYQLLIDELLDVYRLLTGRDGMTNYLYCHEMGHFMVIFTSILNWGEKM